MFKPVPSKVDFVALEREMLRWWEEQGMVEKYLRRNEASRRKWSFIDGHITANNPMGVHHAWGRAYKDLYQRFNHVLLRKSARTWACSLRRIIPTAHPLIRSPPRP